MRRLIFEGPDCGGKDTIIREVFGDVPFHHQGPYNGEPFNESWKVLNETDHHEFFVFNRFYQGEKIYGPVYRGKNTLPRDQENQLDLAMLKRQTILVICLPPFDLVRKNYCARKEQEMFEFDPANLWKIWVGYDSHYCLLPTLYYDFTKETAGDFCLRLEKKFHGWYTD